MRREPFDIPSSLRLAPSGITAGEMRAALVNVPDDVEIVLASDQEGNSYSPLAEVAQGLYEPETTWSGEIRPFDEDVDDPDSDYEPDDRASEESYTVVVLYPTN